MHNDLLINKEESGTPLTTRDLKRKRIYDVNSNAIGRGHATK